MPKKPTKTGVRKVKGWVWIYSETNSDVTFYPPNKETAKDVKEFGIKIIPCTITYKLPITKQNKNHDKKYTLQSRYR